MASAAGLISLSLHCIQAVGFVEMAAQLGSDADIVHYKIGLEQYRLYQLAEQVGHKDCLNLSLDWDLVANILK